MNHYDDDYDPVAELRAAAADLGEAMFGRAVRFVGRLLPDTQPKEVTPADPPAGRGSELEGEGQGAAGRE